MSDAVLWSSVNLACGGLIALGKMAVRHQALDATSLTLLALVEIAFVLGVLGTDPSAVVATLARVEELRS